MQKGPHRVQERENRAREDVVGEEWGARLSIRHGFASGCVTGEGRVGRTHERLGCRMAGFMQMNCGTTFADVHCSEEGHRATLLGAEVVLREVVCTYRGLYCEESEGWLRIRVMKAKCAPRMPSWSTAKLVLASETNRRRWIVTQQLLEAGEMSLRLSREVLQLGMLAAIVADAAQHGVAARIGETLRAEDRARQTLVDHEAHTSFALRRACRGVKGKGKGKGKGRQGGVGIPPVQRERVGVRRPRSAAPVWVSEKLVKWLPVVVPGVGIAASPCSTASSHRPSLHTADAELSPLCSLALPPTPPLAFHKLNASYLDLLGRTPSPAAGSDEDM